MPSAEKPGSTHSCFRGGPVIPVMLRAWHSHGVFHLLKLRGTAFEPGCQFKPTFPLFP